MASRPPIGMSVFPPPGWMARVAHEQARRYHAVALSSLVSSNAAVILTSPPPLEQVRPIIERVRAEIASAPDESALTLRTAAIEIIEKTTGIKVEVATSRQRFALFVAMLVLVIQLAYGEWSDSQLRRELHGLRGVLDSYGQTIGLLVEQERQRASQSAQVQLGTGPTLRVVDRANLREGPSTRTRRIRVLRPGQLLEEIVCVGRWCNVEILANDRARTGMRAWIHRRNVRRVK